MIKNDYIYDQSITDIDDTSPILLLTMKRVSMASNILVKKINYGRINEMPPDEFKGWIFFFFIHLLLGIMLIGFIRTLIADPGRVPEV